MTGESTGREPSELKGPGGTNYVFTQTDLPSITVVG